MKIAEYNDMMSYLTRPGFSGGSKKPTIDDLKKSGQIVTGDKYKPKKPKYIKLQEIIDFELRNPRKTKSEGGPLVPEPKPYTLQEFQERADLLIKGALGGFPKDEMINKLQIELDKVQESGTLSKEEAINFINERTQQLKEYIKNNPGETLPGLETRENKALGSAPDTQAPLTLEESTTGPGGLPMTAGISVLPDAYSTVKKATDFIQSATPAKAKKVVLDFFKQRQPYGGATKVGESTTKDFTPEKNFLSVLKSYMSKFNPTLSGAAKDLGITRNTIRGIQDRINLQETGQRTSNLGFDVYSQKSKVPEPEGGLEFKDVTTLMKNDPDQFKILKKKKDEFLDPESMGHYLGIKFARDDKGIRTGIGKFQYDQLSTQLRNLNVKKNKQGEFSINDTINKLLDKNKSKIVKGQRKSNVGKGRYDVDLKADPELFRLRNNVKTRISGRSQGLDTYLPNAVDDVGHPFSLTKSQEKYKKLFKDSNMNQLNTLVYQDNFINTQLFKNSGYERKYEKMFDKLLNIQNKKVTPEIQKQLLEVKKDMNDNYNYIQDIIKNPKLLDKYINKNTTIADKKFINYLTNQGDRVQKIDINIPKVGEKFKSEDIFVDMSVVNPKYIMGYVNNINPNARKFKDLSLSEQELYRNNVMQQNAEIVSEYYKKAKFPEEDIEAVKETVGMEYAKGGRVNLKEGTPKQPVFKKGAAGQLSKLALVNPASILGLNYLFGIDPESALDRTALGAEAALAKELVRGSQDLIKKLPKEKRRAVQRLLNLGMSPKMAIKAARIASPLGIASLAGEGLYQLGKRGAAEKAKLDAMTPFQKQQYLAGEVEPLMDEGGIVDISREGFADGPEDPSKRKFMKVMGGLTALPFVGKFFKVAERAAPIVDKIKTTDLPGKPEWFDALVNKVIREGTDMTKQFSTKEREIVHATKISEDEFVRVHQDLETGSIRVDYDSPFNMGEETVSLEFRPGIADETTRGKPRDQFQATEVEPRYVGGPEDTDMEFDGIGGGSSIKMLESDVSNLEKYATGKNPTMKEFVDSKKRKDRVKAINEDQLEAAEYISGKYGDGPEPDYDDFID